MMERKQACEYPQELWNLFDLYVHGDIDRRAFLEGAQKFAAGGVTVWSGIDTKNNPGPERVKNECAAGDTDCPLYKEGRSKQLRTNILIGVTGGLALATGLVGALAVDWGGGSKDDTTAKAKKKIQPMAGWSHGPNLGVRGTF